MANGIVSKDNLLKTVHIDYKSDQDGRRYVGDFTIKRLSIADIATLGVRKAQLNGGMHHDPESPGRGIDAVTDELNAILAHLDVAVKKAPDWWDLNDISDMGVIYELFTEVMKFENSFRRPADTDAEGVIENGESGSETKDRGAHSVGAVAAVVEQKVHASLEP